MIAVLALLALPAGFLVRNRTAAYLGYAVVFALTYTFQTAVLVMQWTNGSNEAFPASDSTDLLNNSMGYFAFTTVVGAVGFGLLTLGRGCVVVGRPRPAARSASTSNQLETQGHRARLRPGGPDHPTSKSGCRYAK